jgi:hypothetical protein
MTERTIDPAALLGDAGLDWPPELIQAWAEGDKNLRDMAHSMPRDLPYAVEPAHVFRPARKDKR